MASSRFRALSLACSVAWAAAHPLCFTNDRPTDEGKTSLKLGPSDQYGGGAFLQFGACCTDVEEEEVQAKFDEVGELTADCAEIYEQVVWGKCHSFSAHLFEKLGAELGPWDGMTMTNAFCADLTTKCADELSFPSYEGVSYCDKHTGGDTDQFWAFPYVEDDIYEGGLQDVFPDADDSDFPDETLAMVQTPDGSEFWMAGQGGDVKKIDATEMKTVSEVVDISEGDFYEDFEEGLLGLAFDPEFHDNGFFYLSFTVNLGTSDDPKGQQNRLSKFTYTEDDPTATKDSEEILVTSGEKSNNIHSAGWCGFKPSDYGKGQAFNDLYWTTGDGGPQTDPYNAAQDLTNLLGSMVRISVPSAQGSTGFNIPAGNYQDGTQEVAPELCAPGLRNPFRCSFDRDTDDLYCGDVGHTFVEEVNLIECGKNYGWSRFEGSRCQEAVEDNEFNPPCEGIDRSGFEFPVFEYCHPDYDSSASEEIAYTGGNDFCGDRYIEGTCIIGGFVYRGSYFSDLLAGAYIFSDNVNRNIYFIKKNDEGEWVSGTIVSNKSAQVVTFVEDQQGELMFVTRMGSIYHLPCGDLCSSTCLAQADKQPTIEAVGCYEDDEDNRVLTLKQAGSCSGEEDYMSPEICASYCSTIEGAVYAGVENQKECYCGEADDKLDLNGVLSAGSCSALCASNPDQTCGGTNAIEIFSISETFDVVGPTTPAPIPEGLLGCYQDSKEGRALSTMISAQSPMSATICKELCVGYSFYGTQFSNQCWCGDGADYDTNGAGACDMTCAGASDGEICGGHDSVSVYEGDPTPNGATPAPIPASGTPSPSAGLVTDPGTTPSPAAPLAPVSDEYLGCYADEKDARILGTMVASQEGMNAATCKDLCMGYNFYGTQFGEQCWCGDDASYDVNGPGVCDVACGGTSSGEMCGGVDAVSVYGGAGATAETPSPSTAPGTPAPASTPDTPAPIVEPVSPVSDEYLGCFADAKDARILGTMVAYEEDMSAAICKGLCASFDFYGTQFGGQCWCGDNANYDANGPGICDMACAGASDGEMCGGLDAVSVYASGGGPGPSPVSLTLSPAAVPTPSPEAPPAAPPSDAPVPDGFLGCFTDSKDDRALSEKILSADEMSAAICKPLCEGSKFYGTQFSDECWCGNAEDYGKLGEGACDMVCAGAEDGELCGGLDAISVYENDVVVVTDDPVGLPPSYLGCFADSSTEGRILGTAPVLRSTDMTAEVCKIECNNSAFYGTQFGNECWCGDASSDYDKYGETVCDIECAGDPLEVCGGFDAVSVYEMD